MAIEQRDSSGVHLVVNGGEADSAAVLGEPELRIGQAMGEAAYEFHDLGPVTVDEDRIIFAANGGSVSIRVFGSDGTFLREFGRRGQGPGEFRSIDALLITGDSLIVSDTRARRATVLRKDGTLLDTWDFRLPGGRRAEILARTTNGILATIRQPSRHFSAEPFSIFRDTTELRILDPQTGTTGPLLRNWPGERRIAATEVYPIGPLFEPRTVTAAGKDGTQYHATDGQYAIDVFDPAGIHVRRIRRDVPPTPITPAHVDALRELVGGRSSASEMRTAIERSAVHPLAPFFSTIGAILVAPDGSLLVMRIDEVDAVRLERGSGFGASDRAEYVSRTTAARWERFDPSGLYIGAVRLPVRFFPRHFDGRIVTGVLEDADRVQTIALIRVARGT